MKNPTKRIAVTFVLDGTITGNDDFTLFRIQRALKTSFPASKITDLKLMSFIEETSPTPVHES